MLAPRRVPRNPVVGKRARRSPCSRRTRPPASTRRRAAGGPTPSAVSAANAVSGPACAYPDGSVQRTGGRSGSPVAVHVAARGHDAEVGRPPAGARAVEPERRDADPHRAGRDAPGRASSAPGKPGVSITTSAAASSSSSAGRRARRRRRCACPRSTPRTGAASARSGSPSGGSTRIDLGAEVGEDAAGHRRGLAGEVDDPDPGQQRFGHASTLAAR